MICVAVTYVLQEDREEEALELFRPLAEHARAEPGCRMYIVHRSIDEPRRFFLYEQYVDEEALDAHRASPHFEKYAKNGLFPILEGRSPEIYTLLDI